MSLVEISPLPSRLAVRNSIQDLIGRDVDLSDGVPVESKASNVVAVFVTDRLTTTAVAVCDLEAAARIGGALGMVPKGVVDDAIKSRTLPSPLEENCYEVLNVMSAVFNLPDAPHVRLYEMYTPNATIPPDVAKFAATLGNRMDVKLKIAGYGDGQLSVVVN